jgi:hypothetical protein
MRIVYKKGISIILVMLMVLGGLNGLFVGDGKAYAALPLFAGGDGTEETPYEIESPAQLDEIRDHFGAGVYFQLTADIDLDVSPYKDGEGWEPIGTSDTPFQGHIDGNGFRIMNLRIIKESEHSGYYPDTNSLLGLFGSIGSNGNISNIILENVHVYGYEGIGGLAGENKGIISNSSVSGSVSGQDAGGLVAYISGGTINNSYSTANVVAYDDVGGLVGVIDNNGIITNSYATGSVTALSLDADNVGGLVGIKGTGTITNSFYNRDTTGQVDEGKGLGLTTAEMQLWVFATLTQGTNPGTTRLNNVAVGMEYSIDGDHYTAITGTPVDNIYANVGDAISLRLTATPLSIRTWTIDTTNRKPDAAIATAAIAGITAPVRDATPVATVTESTYYTGTITWSSSPVTFATSTAYTATITIIPKAGYILTGVGADFFTVAGATTVTNAANTGVVTAVFPATAAADTSSSGGGGGGTSTPASDTPATSTDGKLTLPAGKTGEVSLEDEVTVSIPANASGKELKLTIEKVANPQNLLTNKDILVSPVFEILKNFPENFNKPITLTFTFDPTSLKSNQKAVIFYYDEVKKVWVKVGGKVTGNNITVEVDHFTKFAVMAVDDSTITTTEINLSDISGHWAETGIKQAVSIGFIKGYVDGTFKPDQTVTRAEFAVMLMTVLKPQEEGLELTFTDSMKIGNWARKAVAQAVQAGIINGYEDGTFRPNAEITRTEMATMIANTIGQSKGAEATTSFADDKDIPTWARSSVAYMKQASIMQGKGGNKFSPQDHATRAEAVTVLLNMLALENE